MYLYLIGDFTDCFIARVYFYSIKLLIHSDSCNASFDHIIGTKSVIHIGLQSASQIVFIYRQ